jgi:site-specific DNA-cytosine methylase
MPRSVEGSPYVAVGAYIFAGGFTVGMRKHFSVLVHMEDGTFGVQTFKSNHADIPVCQKAHGQWPADKVRQTDVMYGNPPCSAWSAMGSLADGHSWAKEKDWRSSRLGCAESYFELWRMFKPRIWVMESVTQLTTTGRDLLTSMSTESAESGYGMWVVFHDPKFLGLPQTRRRVFVIISSVELPFPRPKCVRNNIEDVLNGMPEPSVVLPITGADLHWYENARPGTDFNSAWLKAGSPVELKPKHRTAHRVALDTPIGTVHSDGHFGHPRHPRYLSAVELAYLSGFPRGYKWPSSDSRARSEVAKGVTPVAAAWLGERLLEGLRRNVSATPGSVTEVNQMAMTPLRSDYDMVDTLRKFKSIKGYIRARR